MGLFRTTRVFGSNEELFVALRGLISELEAGPAVEAAGELQRGLRGVNGLTDGWALLLASIETVNRSMPGDLTAAQALLLCDLRSAVRKAVRRR